MVDRRVVLVRHKVPQAITELREAQYDIAFDLQGLLKSAVLARSSGAKRVVGFASGHLRERWAHLFYTETIEPPGGVHVVDKNMALLAAVGVNDARKQFPLADSRTTSEPQLPERFALVNPGAGWPNKRWPPEWFGEIAHRVHAAYGIPSVVLWGPGEESLARTVVESSRGSAQMAPPTGIGEMIALTRASTVFVAGDTGPLHIAAAVGTPIVGIYGPTSPARNGPWDPADVCVSRFERCECHHQRRCRLDVCCLLDITPDEVQAAVDRRLAAAGIRAASGSPSS